jgi:hypothetical protein
VENGWKLQTAETEFSYFPDQLLTLAGKVFYKHIGNGQIPRNSQEAREDNGKDRTDQ